MVCKICGYPEKCGHFWGLDRGYEYHEYVEDLNNPLK